MSASSCPSDIAPASELGVAFTITITRMSVSSWVDGRGARRRGPRSCDAWSAPDSTAASVLDDRPEAAPEHALPVERQGGRVHAGDALVLHHRGIDAVAILARGIADPGEHHHLVRLELHRLRERGQLAGLHVVGDAFDVFQRAVFQPDLAGLSGDRPVVLDPVTG